MHSPGAGQPVSGVPGLHGLMDDWLRAQQAFLKLGAGLAVPSTDGKGAEQLIAEQYRQLFALPGFASASPGPATPAVALVRYQQAAERFGRLLAEVAIDAARRLGAALADNRPDFQASGQEWRTPPLWGLGLLQTVNGHTNLLHDGRARNVLEAVLWHDGEARSSRDRVKQLLNHAEAVPVPPPAIPGLATLADGLAYIAAPQALGVPELELDWLLLEYVFQVDAGRFEQDVVAKLGREVSVYDSKCVQTRHPAIAEEVVRQLVAERGEKVLDIDLAPLGQLFDPERDRREIEAFAQGDGDAYRGRIEEIARAMNARGVAPLDVKLGNVLIGEKTGALYWVDFERAAIEGTPRYRERLAEHHDLVNRWFGLSLPGGA